MQVNLSNPIVAHPLTLTRTKPHFLPGRTSLPRRPLSHVSFARRPKQTNLSTPSSPKSNNSNKLSKIEDVDDTEDIDDDELEALFKQLEEDLKRDDGDEDLEELTVEDLEKLKKELAEVDEQLAQVFDMTGFEDEDDFDNATDDEDDEEDEDEEEQKPLQLKNWQLRRLAVALKNGRRKTNIKSLAAEICIDRSVVLELLRNPPPSLLMLSASLPDEEPSSPIITVAAAETEMVVEPITKKSPKPAAAPKIPVHELQERFSAQKRIKKAHIQTLEDVYRRSKRPTNAMIKSIVEVTNLPRKKVVKWFEDKREEEGVPEQRTAYQRSDADTSQ